MISLMKSEIRDGVGSDTSIWGSLYIEETEAWGVNEIIPVEGSQPGKTNGMKTEPK